MNRRFIFAALLSLAAVFPAMSVPATTPATFPVIVVFNDNAPLPALPGTGILEDLIGGANPQLLGYLDRGVVGAVQGLQGMLGFRATHIYSAALRGFAARLTARQIDALENNPQVAYVEADGTMKAIVQTLPSGIDRIDADISSTLAGNGSGAVNNVNAYIIDTGIDPSHTDLNVINHVSFVTGGGLLGLFQESDTDCNGHGTHVAGTVAARDNTSDVVGVAPGAPLTGVKVLNCDGSGSTSTVIQGVDWVTANAKKPAIANMSLGGGISQALDDAVRRSANSGVFYSLAAGNEKSDACNTSPARAGAGTNNGIMTTAATDANNNEASFSNFGACVDLWAPGVNVTSTRLGGGTTTFSGTSMASPHAGGTGALYLSSHPAATAATVEVALKYRALRTGTRSKTGRPIKLVYAGTL